MYEGYVVRVLNQASRLRGTFLRFLNIGTRWRREISFTLRPLYLRGNMTRRTMRWWFCGPHSQIRSCREKTDQTSTRQCCSPESSHCVDWATQAHCHSVGCKYCPRHLGTFSQSFVFLALYESHQFVNPASKDGNSYLAGIGFFSSCAWQIHVCSG
jgi:hypothetical protein